MGPAPDHGIFTLFTPTKSLNHQIQMGTNLRSINLNKLNHVIKLKSNQNILKWWDALGSKGLGNDTTTICSSSSILLPTKADPARAAKNKLLGFLGHVV